MTTSQFTQVWGGEAAAGFTNSGAKYGDKPSTLTWVATLHGMYWVNLLLPRPLVSP
jgi:NAD(P)H dehydrogenase (quinone)